MSPAQGPCWVRRRLEARALVILTHTHSEQQVKLFCFAGRVCPADCKSQELNNFFHFLFKNILFFIGLSYVCLCFCLWLCASKSGCPGNPEEGVGIPGARVTCGNHQICVLGTELWVPAAPNCWTFSSASHNPIMLNLKIKLYQLWFISLLPISCCFSVGEKIWIEKKHF